MIDERIVSMRRAEVVMRVEEVLPSAIDSTILAPTTKPRRAALLAPALGVPARFYRPFAEFLAGEGIATLVAECRGPTLRAWADEDLPAALARLRAAYPGLPIAWIGHSMGGQLFGMIPDAP